MAISEGNGNGNGMVMPVSPMYGGGGNGGFGGFGSDGWWILLLILFAGGWNNGFGGGGNVGGVAPYVIDTSVQSGFNQNAIMSSLGDINNNIYGVQSAICNGFAQAEIADNARQIADMQQMFSIQSALQNCCCENRSNIADLKYTVATENCADRTQSLINTRDIIESQTRSTQLILDKLCQQELETLRTQNVSLQNQLNMATLRESQTAQTSTLQRDITNSNASLLNELRACPIPSQPVYGSQPIFSCSNNNGCGCGCGM